MESNQVLKGVIESLPAKTGSGYADTDLIQLYANDGTPNGKIARSALMSCVKDSLGTLLNQGAADLGTSLAKIPALNSGGTLGSATVANLASVLGVWTNSRPDLAGGSSLNDAPLAVTVYYGGSVTEKPSNTGGFVYTFGSYTGGNVNYKMQIAWETLSTNVHYIRTCSNGVWTNWETISQNMPSFYKDYATLAALSNALGVPKNFLIPSNANANSYNYECRVLCNTQGLSSATNFPPSAGYGILEAKTWSNSRVTQEYRGLENPLYHYFRKTDDGGEHWSAWVQLQD